MIIHGIQNSSPMKVEHDELHAQLVKATQESGTVGIAAKPVAKVLHEHFSKEEEYALPPLVLPLVAEGPEKRKICS